MKQISLNEEFSFNGNVWSFIEVDGKVTLKNLRKSRKTASFEPPTLDEVKEFFKLKGYSAESAAKFHEYYSLGDWKDNKGNQVKNWKQKASSVWFRDENKIKEQPKKESSNFLF